MRLIRTLSVLLLPIFVMSCRPSATFYDWPIQTGKKDPRSLYSNLGEKRGASGDGPSWLNHGAADFVAPRSTHVFSPDTGRVEFYGAGNAQRSGIPPVKIGHFSFLHFHNVARLPINPAVMGDANAWTYVVNPGDPIWVVVNNRPQQRTMPRRVHWREGVRQNAASQWEKVFWYNRRWPIGQTTGPDLHSIYYTDPSVPYDRRSAIGNMLGVIKYENSKKPEVVRLRLFAAEPLGGANKEFIADDDTRRRGNMKIPRHQGVDIVVTSSSFKRSNTNRSGIYKLAYSIHRILQPHETPTGTVVPGPGGRRMVEIDSETVMWEYTKMPSPADDKNLVASPPTYVPPGGPVSLFVAVNGNKHTSYVVTNTDGDDTKKWALDNLGRYPDGEYVVTIKAWNISKSKGEGNAPDLGEEKLQRIVSIETDVANQLRMLWVRNP